MSETRITDERLKEMAARLKLTATKANLAELVETATKAGMTPRETLDFFFRNEIENRDSNRIHLGRMSAHFPFHATMDDFKVSFQPSLDPGIMRELLSLEWLSAGDNVVFLGDPGVGKTHLSIALGELALKEGISVRFYPITKLAEQLVRAYEAGTLEQKFKDVNKPKLLILDELGYLPLSKQQGQLLFELISMRYGKKSIILTGSRMPDEWGTVFGDTMIATAILDRLLHHSIPVIIKGKSFRSHECKLRMANKEGGSSSKIDDMSLSYR